ncbi:MAG: 30S ribosomal protein S12 methylthiotransferase RimO [Planctomycetota bacterium]
MAQKGRKRVSVGFVALGCPKNVVDSERMLAEIAQRGYLITSEPESADVVVINTCGFIAPAQAEALEAIEQAAVWRRDGRVKKIVVAGCLPQRLGREVFDHVDGIDAIVGLGQRDNIAGIIEETISCDGQAAYLEEFDGAAADANADIQTLRTQIHDDRVRLRIAPAHWAYLRISEGCSHRCSFCTIPAIRGPFRSKPPELVLAEAAELASAGAVELNLIGQDTTNYGRDLKMRDALGGLLAELEQIPGLAWIRLLYAYPGGVSDRLIKTMADSEKIVHYLDVPIQHINNEILKAMRRPDSKEGICALIEKLRSKIPDVVLRTTVIVGFPGETDGQFEELLKFIEWAEFDALGCFKFYPEYGTPAAEMPGQIPEAVKEQRVEQLMLAQQRIAFAGNKRRLGSRLSCLVDTVDSAGTGRARFYGQAPEIDSVCIMKNCSGSAGRFVEAKVVGTKEYDLIVEQI